jgi:hypothetical protein
MAKTNEARVARNVLEELIGDMPERSKNKLKGILEPTEKKPEAKKLAKAAKETPKPAAKAPKPDKANVKRPGLVMKGSGESKVRRERFDLDKKVRVLKPNAEVIERFQSKFDILKKSKTVGDWYEKCKARSVPCGVPFLYAMVEDGILKIG